MEKFSQKTSSWLRILKSREKFIKYSLPIIVLVVLIFVGNLLIARNFIGGLDFYIKWSSAKALLADKTNPYSSSGFKQLTEQAQSSIYFPLSDENAFAAPVFSLFLYIPFALITDFELARALWMTILCIAFIAVISQSGYDLLDLNTNPWKKIFLIIFVIGNLFSVISILSGDLHILSLMFFLLAYNQIQKGHFELAGIYCALTVINPGLAILALIVIGILSVRQGRWGSVVWFIITTGLLVLLGYLIQENWVAQYLKSAVEVIRNIRSEYSLSGDNVGQILKFGLPVFIVIIEWIRTFPKLHFYKRDQWVFNLTLAMLAIAFSQITPRALILVVPACMQIFYEWNSRENPGAKIIAYSNLGFYVVFSIILVFLDPLILVSQHQLQETVFFISGLHLLLNMYWIRGWISQEEMKTFINPS